MAKLSEIQDKIRWVTLPLYKGVRVALYSTDDPHYRLAMMEGAMPWMDRIRRGEIIPPGASDAMTIAATAEYLLQDWEGIEDAAGKPVPFSRTLAVEWSRDDRYRGFFLIIQRKADELAGRRT